jgi:hypothetical protein
MGRARYAQVLQSSSDGKADAREEGVRLSDNSNKQELWSQTKQTRTQRSVFVFKKYNIIISHLTHNVHARTNLLKTSYHTRDTTPKAPIISLLTLTICPRRMPTSYKHRHSTCSTQREGRR